MFEPKHWGRACDAGFYDRLTKEEDLLDYEGSLLSLFRDESSRPWLFLWCDTTPGAEGWHRWLVLPVAEEALEEYRQGTRGLRELLLDPASGPSRLLDLDGEIRPLRCFEGEAHRLPEDYLPQENAYGPGAG